MGETNVLLLDPELIFPVTFIEKIIKAVENKQSLDLNGKLDVPGKDEHVKITTETLDKEQSEIFVVVKFSHLRFQFENEKHVCKITSCLNEKTLYKHETASADANFAPTDAALIKKRPRGRPRKTVKTTQEKSSEKNDKEEHNPQGTDSIKHVTCHAENITLSKDLEVDNSLRQKKYSLRGAKLNTAIMNAVRGVYDETESSASKRGNKDDANVNFNDVEGILNEYTENDEESFEEEDEDSDYDENGDLNNKRKRKQRLQTGHKENLSTKPAEKMSSYLANIPKHERRKRVSKDCHCKICNKTLIDYTGVFDHVKKMHSNFPESDDYLVELTELKKEKCTECGEILPDRIKLLAHEDKEHSDRNPSECFRCKKMFKSVSSLKTHVKQMHLEEGKKHGLCHLCPATFRSVGTLQQHIDEIHLGNKHVECHVCKKKFYNHSQLRRHSRIHGLDESKRIFCSVCDKSFLFKHNLQRHMTSVHGNQSEAFHCSYCGKGFCQKTGMITHVQIVHFNLFPFSCQLCKAIFSRSAMLKDHMASFHKQTNYQVEKMPKNSIYNKTVEDLFYCSYCSIGFHNKTKLVIHMHTDHADAFPFSCKTCKQGFLEKAYLIVHRLKAHGEWIQDDNEIVERPSGDINKIMQYISTKTGGTNKVLSLNSEEEVPDDTQRLTKEINTAEAVEIIDMGVICNQEGISSEGVTQPSSQPSSLIVEVESGTNTYRYLIETPDNFGETGSVTVAQDIANLLLAAEHTIHEESAPNNHHHELQQISLVINDESAIVPSEENVSMETVAEMDYSGNPEVVVETVAMLPPENDNNGTRMKARSDFKLSREPKEVPRPEISKSDLAKNLESVDSTESEEYNKSGCGSVLEGVADGIGTAEVSGAMIDDGSEVIHIHNLQIVDTDSSAMVTLSAEDIEDSGVDILQLAAIETVNSGQQESVDIVVEETVC